jgi:hypothetical protein
MRVQARDPLHFTLHTGFGCEVKAIEQHNLTVATGIGFVKDR